MPNIKKRHVRQSKLASFNVMYKMCVILGIFVRLVLMLKMLVGGHLVDLSCIGTSRGFMASVSPFTYTWCYPKIRGI